MCIVAGQSRYSSTGFLTRSTNYGANFTQVPGTVLGSWYSVSITANGSWAVACLYQGALYRRNNSGATFYAIPGTAGTGGTLYYWVGLACGKESPYCIAGRKRMHFTKHSISFLYEARG